MNSQPNDFSINITDFHFLVTGVCMYVCDVGIIVFTVLSMLWWFSGSLTKGLRNGVLLDVPVTFTVLLLSVYACGNVCLHGRGLPVEQWKERH